MTFIFFKYFNLLLISFAFVQDLSINNGLSSNTGDGFYDLRQSLPSGYVKNGSVDYTNYIQLAIMRYDNIRFPGFPILVNDKGLKIGSNKNLYFEKGSEIWLKPSKNGKYDIFNITNVKNVRLTNPVVKGDRYSHLGTSGEWGMGIGIYSSENIEIVNAKVINCWGDGIYLGTAGGAPSKNIQILNAHCKYNRRNGISVISVNGLLLQSPYAGYSNGTPPMAGIDIEPNSYYNEVKNIKINSPKTEYNGGAGITLSLSKIYGGDDKNLSIEISQHFDKKSNIGLRMSCYPKRQLKDEEVRGTIVINRPTWVQNAKVPIQTALFQKNLVLKITGPTIIDRENKSLTKPEMQKLLAAKGHVNPDAQSIISY